MSTSDWCLLVMAVVLLLGLWIYRDGFCPYCKTGRIEHHWQQGNWCDNPGCETNLGSGFQP